MPVCLRKTRVLGRDGIEFHFCFSPRLSNFLFSKTPNKYTPEDLIMSNMAILQRDPPLSNHFQTHLRSIYPNLSKWNPHILHALTLKSQLDALREPLGFLGCPSGRNDPVCTTKWPFLRKKLVLLWHLSMSANRDSTAAVMAFFVGLVWTSGQPARYTKHTTSQFSFKLDASKLLRHCLNPT